MNTSILPRILALYCQNKHHFSQVWHVWSFSAICWQVFPHLTQFFHRVLHKTRTKSSICCFHGNIQSLANRHSMGQWKTGQRKRCQKWYPGSSRTDRWNAWRLKIWFTNEKRCFHCHFRKKNFFKMISLFIIFVCEDRKQLFYIYGAIFQFYTKACPEDAEDADIRNYADPHHHIQSDAL